MMKTVFQESVRNPSSLFLKFGLLHRSAAFFHERFRCLLLVIMGLVGFVQCGGAAGQVVAWGDNTYGQTSVPPDLTNAVAVAAGGSHSLALRDDGMVVAWGANWSGQASVPSGMTGVVAIAAGWDYSLALRSDGTVAAWGDNLQGQTEVPPGLTKVVGIACGYWHSLALVEGGTIVAWGGNTYGRTNVPPGLTNVVAIAAGGAHSLALRSDGTVAAWGLNDHSQTTVPPGLTNLVALAAGFDHSLGLRTDGTVAAWGWNQNGQATLPSGLSNAVAIAGGTWQSMALTASGAIVLWGDHGVPPVPDGLSDVVAIDLISEHGVAIVSDGSPMVTVHPFSQSIVTGHEATLRVMAVGRGPLSYQWRRNGTDLTTATDAILRLPAVQPGDGGSYTVIVSNSVGQAESKPAELTAVLSPPLIGVQPASQRVYSGVNVTFGVAADGSWPLSYQWRRNGADLTGATDADLRLVAAQPDDGGSYTVVVGNAAGQTESEPAELTILVGPPLIRVQPTNQYISYGGSAMLHVTAEGSLPFSHQWFFGNVAIAAATNATLAISNASLGHVGPYTLVIANSYGAITSAPALLRLVFDYDFQTPDGPLLWDFSGTYPSPLGTLQQNENGFLVNNVGAQGRVWPNGSSVGVSLTRSWAPYWIEFSSTHVEYIFQDNCTTTLTLDPGQRLLVGNSSCVTVGQEYVLFLFTWAAYRNLTTNRYSAPIDPPLPLPDGVDGHWKLALDVVPNGNQLTGQAFITLSSGKVIALEITDTNSTVNKSVLKLQSAFNHLEVVTTGPEMALQSIHGNAAGQSIDYVSPLRTSLLTLNINGSGNGTPPMNGQTLEIGRDYTLKPAPRPGNLFSNWIVAGTVVTNPTLRFTMSSNLVITANFVTNPFVGLKGSYSGLFYDTNEPSHFSAGFFTLALTDKGSFSGKLQQGAAKYSFSGQFDLALSAQKTVPRRGTNDVVVRLQLAGGSDRLIGVVSNAAWSSELFGYRADFNSKSNPATNFQGNYTLLLPGADDSANGPVGHGFAQLGVNSVGSVSFKGTLGDGSAAVQKVPLAANGQWPLYVGLHSGKGSVFGWLTLFNTPTNDVIGPVLWTKPSGVKGPLHCAGFTNELESMGSRYVAPASGTRVLDFTSAGLVLGGGNLPATLTNAVILSVQNKVTAEVPNTQKLSLTLSVSSGSFKGSFVHPQTRKPSAIKGVLLQKQNFGAGFFPGTNQSGHVFFGELDSD